MKVNFCKWYVIYTVKLLQKLLFLSIQYQLCFMQWRCHGGGGGGGMIPPPWLLLFVCLFVCLFFACQLSGQSWPWWYYPPLSDFFRAGAKFLASRNSSETFCPPPPPPQANTLAPPRAGFMPAPHIFYKHLRSIITWK